MAYEVDLPEGALLSESPWPSMSVVHLRVHDSPSPLDLPDGGHAWSPQRAAQWWAGRRALSAACAAQGMPHVSIEVSPLGAPRVQGLSVSIAHTRDLAVAVASRAWKRLGVDLERSDRNVESLTRAFSGDERALVDSGNARALELLMAKEAASKAIGTGLEGSLTRWPVHMHDGAMLVRSPESAELRVRLYEFADWLGAIAVGSELVEGSELGDA